MNPDFHPSLGVNGRWSANTGRKCPFEGMDKNGTRGCAKAIRLIDAAYVESSNKPFPQGGRREFNEPCNGPAKLTGPTGPEIAHARGLRSVSRMAMSASPLSGWR